MFKKIALSLMAILVTINFAEACPAGLRAFNKKLAGKDACVLEGTYVGKLQLTSGYNYILLGAVWIGSEKRDSNLKLLEPIQPGQLTVSPGVSIFALNPAKDKTGVWAQFNDSNGVPVAGDIKSFLSVSRDSKLIIKGTASAPVLMSSAQGEHLQASTVAKRPGDWGGLVLNGKAKSNKCKDFATCTLPGEANTGWYGGDDDNHSTGVMEYLQVEYGGDRIDSEKELNGITFNAIGLGTLINNIAVLYNSDDCVEFFGGAVTAKNIFCYKGEDDGIDTTDGARIFLQNGVVVAGDYPNAGQDNDRHMVEADSSKSEDNNKLLRAHPVLANFTFVGGLNSQGFKLRRGTDYTIVNSVMVGVDTWCMDPKTANDLFIHSNAFADCKNGDPIMQMSKNDFVTASVLQLQGWVPMAHSPVFTGAQIMDEFLPEDPDLDDAFADAYEDVEYRGAMGQDVWTDWIQTRD